MLPVPDMPPFLLLRRSTRDHHPSTRYSSHEYVLLIDEGEPECYAEAIEDEHKKEWFEAMQDEINSLHENSTFELARLVVKDFSQKRGIDFDEFFFPVVKMGSIRVVLGLAASLDLKVTGKEGYVCGLQKSLYGLKQAPRQWYKKFKSVIGKQGYRKTSSDHCVFFQKFGDDDFIILLLYVDDMLIVGKNIGRIAQLKRDLSKSFSMKDLGPAKQIIGIRIFRDRGAKKLHISQEQYIEKVLCRFNMDKAKVVSSPLTTNFKLTDKDCPSSKKNIEKMDRVPYASAVGSLMYAMVCTRPNLAHAVGGFSQFLSNPGKKHWEAVKWIFRYLRGTSKLGITFGNGKPMLVGFTDSDMAGNKDNMKSTSGYLMTFAGGAVSWQSRLQKCVALSTTEAEYMAATEACKELLWLKRFLQELGFKQQRYAVLCDNQSAIHLAKNSMFHKRTKHIDIRYHWIRDAIEDGMFELNKVHTDDNASDMLTKAVAREKLKLSLWNLRAMVSDGAGVFLLMKTSLAFVGLWLSLWFGQLYEGSREGLHSLNLVDNGRCGSLLRTLKRKCPQYLEELLKKKKNTASGAGWWFQDHGIIAHRTPPYTPQHNGVSERRNRTLLDMVRSMMSQTTLPKSFWDYALETAARILNMVPTKKVETGHIRMELVDLEIIQEEDTHPSIDTSLNHEEDDLEMDEPQIWVILGEPANYKAALLDPESDKWLNAMNVEMQSMKDNEVWILVETSLLMANRWLASGLLEKGLTWMDAQTLELFRILIPICVLDMRIGKWIVKTAFHQWIFNEEVVMEQPEGEAAYILGIKIYRDRSRRLIGLCQSAYIEKILKRFHMENSKRGSIPMQDKLRLSKSQGASTPAELKRMQSVPYASAVGSIMYAVRCTRPDVAFAQNITSRFQQNPGDLHWTTVKNILKYLRNTKDMFLVYGGDLKRELRVSCYTDAGYLTDADDLKSQTGYVFVLNGGAVDWKSAKQSIFATSSAEAEYIAAFDASKEAVWVRKFISGLGVVPTIEKPINMYCDNTGAIAIANESGITKGARHFRAKVHYLREVIEFGDIKLEKVHTDDNLADPFTKALAFPKHSELTRNIGMLPASSFM
ncbi:putative RNA-directed DNA polymerase [Tanacetum coccineum]